MRRRLLLSVASVTLAACGGRVDPSELPGLYELTGPVAPQALNQGDRLAEWQKYYADDTVKTGNLFLEPNGNFRLLFDTGYNRSVEGTYVLHGDTIDFNSPYDRAVYGLIGVFKNAKTIEVTGTIIGIRFPLGTYRKR